MTRFTTSSFLLLICSVLGVTLAVGAVTSQAERQCVKASKAACVWVSRPWGHTAKAHVVTPCQDEGATCTFSSTCHVNDVPRDIFHCQVKDAEPKHIKLGRRKRKYGKAEATLSHVHKRQRRSAEEEGAEEDGAITTTIVPKEKVPNATKGSSKKVPSFFQQLMKKHRSYNAAAFTKGTFIINPMSDSKRESVKIQPVRSNGNSPPTEREEPD